MLTYGDAYDTADFDTDFDDTADTDYDAGWPVGFGRLSTTIFFSPYYRLIIELLILYRLILSSCQ